jgi:dephospho-CoA kinase
VSLKIGITGSIGCGKSTILGWLAEHGAQVIDADQLTRELMAPGTPVVEAIRKAFGPGVVKDDGGLDRAALATIVFGDPERLRELEAITHPIVRARILELFEQARAAGAPLVALEAIRLVEGGYGSLLDEVWLVTCRPDAQAARLAARGLDPADADARIAAQSELAKRAGRSASRVIDTSDSLERTRALVEAALADALERQAAR